MCEVLMQSMFKERMKERSVHRNPTLWLLWDRCTSGLKPVAWLTEEELIPIMFLNPQQFVLSSKVTLREKKNDIKLNAGWIMHVGAKLDYTVIYLIDWCYGSEVQFPLLRSHFIASYSSISNLYISKIVYFHFFFSLTPGKGGCVSSSQG